MLISPEPNIVLDAKSKLRVRTSGLSFVAPVILMPPTVEPFPT